MLSDLQALPVPDLTSLPIDKIPELTHPIVVHFAIALPVAILLIEIFNVFFKRPSTSFSALFLLLVTAAVFFGAYVSGVVDAQAGFISDEAKATFNEHKQLGLLLVYGISIPIVLKLLSMISNKGFVKFVYLLSLAALMGVLVEQGKEGGELVYKHGVNVSAVSDMEDRADDLEMALDECNETLAAQAEGATPDEMIVISPSEVVVKAPVVEQALEVPAVQSEPVTEDDVQPASTINVHQEQTVNVVEAVAEDVVDVEAPLVIVTDESNGSVEPVVPEFMH